MKLSTAMRKGSRMSQGITGKWWDSDGGTCAMGAVVLGFLGHLPAKGVHMLLAPDILIPAFPLLHTRVSCPSQACSSRTYNVSFADLMIMPSMGPYSDWLMAMIIHLNDSHGWTRERIAGWIEAQVETPTYSLLQMQQFMTDEQEAAREALAEVNK